VRKDLQANNVAMWMVWETGRKLLREICELLGGSDYAAVAQRIRRTRSVYTPRARSNLITETLIFKFDLVFFPASTNELAPAKNLVRSTAWEIHPATKLRRSESKACSGDIFQS
jgi:hypothetical protein